MRPKKVVLFMSPDEQYLSCQAFLLETRGYRVLRAIFPAHALAILETRAHGTVDVLVAEFDVIREGNELVSRAKQLHGGLPVLLLSRTILGWDQQLEADVFLPKGCHGAAELVERIRVLAARKRGPKKVAGALLDGKEYREFPAEAIRG